MTNRTIAAIAILLLVIVAGRASADAGALPIVVAAPGQSVAMVIARSIASGRCWAADCEFGHGAQFASGTTSSTLPAGRYRLHFLVSRAPLGDVYSNAVSVTVRSGADSTTPPALKFEVADEFIDVPLVTALDSARPLRAEVSWSVTADAQKDKKKYSDLSTLDPDNPTQAPDESGGSQLPASGADGSIAVADLPKIPVVAAVCGVIVEPLPQVAATVSTDKIIYRVGDTGNATIVITNPTDSPQSAIIESSIVSDVDTRTKLGSQSVDLPANGNKTLTVPFKTSSLKWGAEFRLIVTTAGGLIDTSQAVFAVHNDFWAVSMLGGIGPDDDGRFKDPANAEAKIEQLRASGETGFEGVFWAPDDFGDFNPQTEDFLGGQTMYRESISGTKNLIAAAHKNGMYATVYSNLWGGDGVSGFELMRKHPDWYGWASIGNEWLEMWDRLQQHKLPEFEQWVLNCLVHDTGATGNAAISYHAQQLIDTHEQFGWDGVRYDSYDSNPWVVWATGLARSLVAKKVPDFGFGYNSSPSTDDKNGALDTMLSGGGMEMVEYADPESYSSLAGYMGELAHCRDLVWAHGGHLGPLYRAGTPSGFKAGLAVPLDAVYMTSAVMATGGHPYYSPLEHSVANHPEFALRYASLLWDNSLVLVKNVADVVQFGAGDKPMLWQTLARTGMVDGHYRLILHLINAPADYQFYTDDQMKTPPPMRNLSIAVTLPVGSTVTRALDLSPLRGLDPVTLEPRVKDSVVRVSLPDVRFYDIFVLDFSGPKGLS